MATTKKEPPKKPVVATKNKVEPYQSNPFLLAFHSLGKLFDVNKNWAIAILVIFIISGIFSFFGNMVNVMLDSQRFRDNRYDSSRRWDRDRKSIFDENRSLSANEAEQNITDTVNKKLDNKNINKALPAIIAVVIVVSIIIILIVIVSMAFGTFILGMISYVTTKSVDGVTVGFTDALQAAASKFWLLFLAQLLASLKIFAWSLLFIVPGIIAALRYAILPYVIMAEEKMSVGEAHNRTKTLVKGRLWEMFGISFVSGIVPFIGEVLGMTGYAAAYRQLQVTHDGAIERPKIHWLNYLGMGLIAFFLIVGLLIAGLVLVAVLAARS